MKQTGVMSLCATCEFAEWERTANGRRHPNGQGRCTFVLPDSPLPRWLVERRYGRDAERFTRLQQVIDHRWSNRSIYWRDYHSAAPIPCETWAEKGRQCE